MDEYDYSKEPPKPQSAKTQPWNPTAATAGTSPITFKQAWESSLRENQDQRLFVEATREFPKIGDPNIVP